MFKHKVKYVDFNGTDREEELYFHLSLPEVTRIEAEIGRPIDVHVKDLVANQKLSELLAFLEKMMLSSYGHKTSDGRSFKKTEEIRNEFEYSQAYAELFEEMLTNPSLAEKFGTHVAETGKSKKNKVEPKVVTD